MSDMSIVIVGVVSILSFVSLVTWLARPAEFRVKAATPAPAPSMAVPAPVVPPPVPVVVAQPATALMNALPEKSLSERLAVHQPTPRRRRRSAARSFLYVTKVPTRR